MTRMRGTQILLLLFTLSIGTQSGSATEPTSSVTCDTNGTISVSGNAIIKSVFGECDNDGAKILKYLSKETSDFTLTGCPLNKPVKIILYNIPESRKVAVPSHMLSEYTVICNGSNIAVTQAIDGHLAFPTAATSVPLQAKLGMTVLNSDDTELKTDVDIENTYKLKITGPAGMYILVESCDAAPDNTFKTDSVSLYANRAPNTDYNVLKQFPSNTSSETTSEMTGFRLLGASVIHIRCIVDICQHVNCPFFTTTTTTTTTKTPPTTPTAASTVKRRRRRDVRMTDRRIALSTSFRVKRMNATSGTNGNRSASKLTAVFAVVVVSRYLSLR